MLNLLSVMPLDYDEEFLVGFFVGLMILIIIGSIIGLICSVITIIGEWKVFERAGKPGWAAIVPFYNQWVLFELGDVNPVFIFFGVGGSILSCIPNGINVIARDFPMLYPLSILLSLVSMGLSITMIVFSIKACIRLAEKFGKGAGYGVGLALLGVVFFPLLALDKEAVYNDTNK